ncbi:MAG: helix-turn-helix domain-containing protein [bacterium]
MSLNRAAAIEPENSQRPRRSNTSTNAPVPLRIAERPVRGRMLRLVELAMSLLKEAETLALDKNFTEQSGRLQTLDLAQGVDFYMEVERFETGMIRLALDQTHGNQARAAKLLHIRPTTLNTKIKLYGIEF